MGNGIGGNSKIIIYFSLTLLIMSILIFPFIDPETPEFVALIITIIVNIITIISIYLLFRRLKK